MIKLFKPYMSFRARAYANMVLRGTQLAEGPKVRLFEFVWAKYFDLDPKRAVAVNSGTSALEIAYELIGIRKGDEVIVPVLTCTATTVPLIRRGAKVVFADINKGLLMDPGEVKKRITKKTKAIVYVDFGGASDTLPAIKEIANAHHIPLVQDAAQSFGVEFQPLGDFIAMSFQAIKTLTCGDGGMLYCQEELMAYQARKLRWFGYDRELKHQQGDADLELAGFKMHMNDIAAAIGLGNLYSIEKPLKHRINISREYANSGLPILCYPWLTILTAPHAHLIKKHLEKLGIETGQHHYRNDKYTIFGKRRKDLPVMDEMENQYLLLPYHQDISIKDVKFITGKIQEFIKLNGG